MYNMKMVRDDIAPQKNNTNHETSPMPLTDIKNISYEKIKKHHHLKNDIVENSAKIDIKQSLKAENRSDKDLTSNNYVKSYSNLKSPTIEERFGPIDQLLNLDQDDEFDIVKSILNNRPKTGTFEDYLNSTSVFIPVADDELNSSR